MIVNKFTVEGKGAFPIDMLRYDRCSPLTESDSHLIEHSFIPGATGYSRSPRTIKLGSERESLTVGRWESFGWKVLS